MSVLESTKLSAPISSSILGCINFQVEVQLFSPVGGRINLALSKWTLKSIRLKIGISKFFL